MSLCIPELLIPEYVYILFEHKSYLERSIAFHILRYMVKIWEKKNDHGFPVIIPLVLYHGETRWRVGLNFRDLFDFPEEVASFIPDFQYLLWDASGYSDEEIKGSIVLRVALLILKYIFREDLREHLPRILRLLLGCWNAGMQNLYWCSQSANRQIDGWKKWI